MSVQEAMTTHNSLVAPTATETRKGLVCLDMMSSPTGQNSHFGTLLSISEHPLSIGVSYRIVLTIVLLNLILLFGSGMYGGGRGSSVGRERDSY